MREGQVPLQRSFPATRTIGRTSCPPDLSMAATTGRAANSPGSAARLYRETLAPWEPNQRRSASKRASSGFTVSPQTPVEQHIAWSKTSMVAVMVFLSGQWVDQVVTGGRVPPLR